MTAIFRIFLLIDTIYKYIKYSYNLYSPDLDNILFHGNCLYGCIKSSVNKYFLLLIYVLRIVSIKYKTNALIFSESLTGELPSPCQLLCIQVKSAVHKCTHCVPIFLYTHHVTLYWYNPTISLIRRTLAIYRLKTYQSNFCYKNSRWLTVAMVRRVFGERVFHTRRKGLQNTTNERAEERYKATLRRERLLAVHFVHFEMWTFNWGPEGKIPIDYCRRSPSPDGPQPPAPLQPIDIPIDTNTPDNTNRYPNP